MLCFLNLPSVGATNEPAPPNEGFSTDALFKTGRFEGGVNSGVMFSPFIATYQRPTINYTVTGMQVGYMLSDVKGTNWLRGNFEVAGEGFGSAIFDGPGSYIAGVTVWGRYNFVPVKSRFVPFAEAGLGLTSTDIDREIVGQPFNFNLDLGLGTRYFLSQKWALTLEYRFQHISNANTGRHNLGINAQGPVLGVAHVF